MGIGDMADKAKDLAAENADKVEEGIEKAGDMADEKTGGKFSEQVDKGQDAAGEYVEGLGDEENTEE